MSSKSFSFVFNLNERTIAKNHPLSKNLFFLRNSSFLIFTTRYFASPPGSETGLHYRLLQYQSVPLHSEIFFGKLSNFWRVLRKKNLAEQLLRLCQPWPPNVIFNGRRLVGPLQWRLMASSLISGDGIWLWKIVQNVGRLTTARWASTHKRYTEHN